MSTYKDLAFNPVTRAVEEATWIDDYFGKHQYGVQFGTGPVYRPDKVRIPKDHMPAARHPGGNGGGT